MRADGKKPPPIREKNSDGPGSGLRFRNTTGVLAAFALLMMTPAAWSTGLISMVLYFLVRNRSILSF
ncbi:hypothetical protein PDUR_17120 [Paenibacillus durus]|uniref:Uncharacterized protein n=1 Tax=Paenibacillus durus TaxID=44251 RepID=A0A089HSY8_PAEDU|nr:hypothetical protein PDUR_17120 [Paenibacillus durus]